MTLPPLVLLAAVASLDDGMAAHDRLDRAMFWVGAMFAFTPIVVGLIVASVIWWQRRRKQEATDRTP